MTSISGSVEVIGDLAEIQWRAVDGSHLRVD